MHEDIAKSALSAAKFLFHWLVWSIVLFNVGRAALLLVTFGRYPRGRDVERDANKISLAGAIVLALTWSFIAIYNNMAGVHA